MDGQGQEGERGQRLEGASLVGAFLDPEDLEDDQEQPQKRQVAQKRPQAAAAVFGLAGIEPGLRIAARCLRREVLPAGTAGGAPVSAWGGPGSGSWSPSNWPLSAFPISIAVVSCRSCDRPFCPSDHPSQGAGQPGGLFLDLI